MMLEGQNKNKTFPVTFSTTPLRDLKDNEHRSDTSGLQIKHILHKIHKTSATGRCVSHGEFSSVCAVTGLGDMRFHHA